MIIPKKHDEHLAIEAQLLGQSESHLICPNSSSPHLFIHKEILKAYNEMVKAALKDNISIEIASGFRSFDRQLTIWNNKFSGKTAIKDSDNNIVNIDKLSDIARVHAILLYSALPGASRHHWGCDIDVYAPNLLGFEEKLQLEPWEYQQNGPMHKLSLWLDKYASDFGFYRPYESYQGGVATEPWHLSYKPISDSYQQAFNLTTLENCIKQADILGKKAIIDNLALIAERYILV